mgnify:CR=1 FL=1
MEKVLGQCHAEEKCHLSQNAMGKAKEDQMAPTKASLSVNKYADSFLLFQEQPTRPMPTWPAGLCA